MRSRRLLGNPSADLTLKGYEYGPERRGNKTGSLMQRLNVRRSVKLALLIHWFNGSINFLICNLCLLMDLMSLREFICNELTGVMFWRGPALAVPSAAFHEGLEAEDGGRKKWCVHFTRVLNN